MTLLAAWMRDEAKVETDDEGQSSRFAFHAIGVSNRDVEGGRPSRPRAIFS